MLTVLRRLIAFVRRDRLEAELLDEVQQHIELRRLALIDRGMEPGEAAHEAKRQFGNVTVVRERSRDEWGGSWITSSLRDLRYAGRVMARTPGITATVLLAIAFGSGVNAALFLVLNNTFLRSPDLPDADRLVWVDDGRPMSGISYPDYVDYRDRTTAFSDLAAFALTSVTARMAGDDQPARIRGVLASGNYFSALRTNAAIGRTFGGAEDLPPVGSATVVLSDGYWSRRFNRDPGVLGQTVDLNFKPFRIVGVMPRGFSGLRNPNGDPYVPDIWIPMWSLPSLEPGDRRLVHRTTTWGLQAVGRLRDEVSLSQARAQIVTVASALDRQYSGQRSPRTPWALGVTDVDLRLLRGESGIVAAVVTVVSIFVLLIACANVGGLLLARVSTRRREVAVRLSLGASRARIVRQFLTEGLLLSVAGTLLGHVAATGIIKTLLATGEARPVAWSFVPDARMLAFALVLAVIAAISTGLLPALQASKTSLLSALNRSETARIGRLRAALVATEVAASLILLLGTALLVRGLVRAHSIDPTMPVDRLLTVDVDATLHGYEGVRHESLLLEIRRQIEAIPGVQATALVAPAPFSGSRHRTTLRLADAPDAPAVQTYVADASSSFVETADVQVIRGRWLDERSTDEVVINESLAARLWPKSDPLGARLKSGEFNNAFHVVVGIARDLEYKTLRDRGDLLFFRPGRGGTILVRTAGPPSASIPLITDAVARIDRQLVVSTTPIVAGIADELRTGRLAIASAAAVGALALIMALAGIASIAAQSVAQRTHEIGIRMALGAERRDAVFFIVRRALVPVAIGAVLGLLVASQASRVLAVQLYGVSPRDPIAFATAVVLVMVSAAVAAWIPGRRAASIDPVIALRSE
jgi:predicted permease